MTITFADRDTVEWLTGNSDHASETPGSDLDLDVRFHWKIDRMGEPELVGCSAGALALTSAQAIAMLGQEQFYRLYENGWIEAEEHERGRQECLASERDDA